MSDTPRNPANYCYRHPDRQSFILCQRCGRTICPQCQTQAAVGVHCPECIQEARQSAPKTKPRFVTALLSGRQPVVTYSIIALCVIIYGLQLLTGGVVGSALLYWSGYTVSEPWRMITALFVHSEGSFLHILFNMYSLFIFGPLLERMVGHGRFLALYLLSGFGGSVAVLLLAPNSAVVGASGAIFGLLSAFFVIQRRLVGTNVQLLVVIVLNLAIGFLPGMNISWQAHVGGLVVGAAIAFVFMRTRQVRQKRLQILLLTGIGLALVLLTVIGVALLR